jgi:hypothetical protein
MMNLLIGAFCANQGGDAKQPPNSLTDFLDA